MGDSSQEYKEDAEEENDDSKKSSKSEEPKAEENGKEEVIDKEEKQEEQEDKEDEAESQASRPASETQSPPFPCLSVLSGSDPDLGPQLLKAAAKGLPVLLTNVELGLRCQELPWLLQREQLSPPQVQPGFCLYLSTTLPLGALKKGCELLKVLNVLDLGLNMDILEEQMLQEILCMECPKYESRWQILQMRTLDTLEAAEAVQERLLLRLLYKNPNDRRLAKFLRDMVRDQAELCQLLAYREELEDLKLQEMLQWVPYQQVVQHGIAIIRALSPLQDLLPPFRMSPENWLAATKRALNNMKQCENHPGKDLNGHLLQMKARLTRQLLGSMVDALGLTHIPLVGALGALALLCETRKAPLLERLALWPGLEASPSMGSSKPIPVLGPAPGPDLLSLLQKLILWRVLKPECLAGALADFTTSLLGRPLDENLGPSTIPFEQSQATRPLLVLLPPPGHPTATLHPLAVIQKLADQHEQGQKHLEVIALGSEAWNPVSDVVSTLCQAMYEGHWLVLENCHLMPHWPKELLQPLLQLLDGAEVSDPESELLLASSASGNMVHKDFRLWLIASAESIASLPAVLTHHCMPVFWEQSLELGHVLLDNVELAQQELYVQPLTRTMPLLLLHGLLLHRQLYGNKLQAHRGHWNQVTLTQVLQMQDQLWASLSNPHAAMEELAASVFYGGPVGDNKDREALISLIHACLSPSRSSWDQPHTPQNLLATLTPSPDLDELDALSECKAQMHQLPTPPDPRTCGLSAGPQAWLLRHQSRALLRALQRCSLIWVSAPGGSGHAKRQRRRLQQRLVLATQALESLQALLTQTTPQESGARWLKMGLTAGQAVEGFLHTEVQELSQLVSTLQEDLSCLLQQLEGVRTCLSQRCVAVANALWAGRLPLPWRRHAPAWLQPPWLWLRQLSRRGEQLIRYLGVGTAAAPAPKRIFHLSAFRHPHRLLLSLRWEAAFATGPLDYPVPSLNVPGAEGLSSRHFPHKYQELKSSPLHLQVVSSPKPMVPEAGAVLLIGLQLWNAQWDALAGALKDGPTSQPSPLPPVSVSTQARDTNDPPPFTGLPVYSCPVYMEGPLGTASLNSKNILMYLPMPTKLSPAICVQRRVHVYSPPLP